MEFSDLVLGIYVTLLTGGMAALTVNRLNRVDDRIDVLRTELKSDIAELRNEVHGEIKSLRGEINSFRGEINSLRGEINSLRSDLTQVALAVGVNRPPRASGSN